MKKRLAVVTTHPIQYHSPWFRAMHESGDLEIEVYYGHRAGAPDQAAAGFGVEFEWDTPLLEGYPHEFLRNVAKRPSATTFLGIDTPQVGSILTKGKFDAVMVNGWHYKGAWQAFAACRRASVPLMVRGDSHLHSPRGRIRSILKWLPYRCFIPRFDACLAAGSWSREYFLAYGAREESIHVVPHSIDVQWFWDESRRLRDKRRGLRAVWGLKPEATVFLMAGKLLASKRPMDFIRAIEAASRREANVAGLLVGDGPMRGPCTQYVEANHLPVRFAGFLNQSRMPEAYVAADALVLPSEETWGLVVNESMACARPCLVTDRAGCGPDLIVSGETGCVFPFGESDALADLMVSLARGGRPAHMGEAAQAASRHFSAQAAAAATVRAMEAVS